MLLTTTPFEGLGALLPVILWIVLPIAAFSLLVILLLHYGKKIRRNGSGDEELYESLANSAPENFCYRAEDGSFVYLDHTGLLKDFRKKLAYSHARYAALKQDFTQLRSQMDEPGHTAPGLPHKLQPNRMEYNSTTTLLQQEAQDEKDILPVSTATACFNDLLAERDKQIGFLQSQIDLRVKNHHYAEQVKEALQQQLQRSEQAAKDMADELSSLKGDLREQQEEMKTLQALADEGGRELNEARQLLDSRQKQIICLENVLQELQDQNRLLQASVADEADRYRALEDQLELKESKLKAAQEKLAVQKQLLQRLHTEVANCISEEADNSQVVVFRPEYINPEWEESAVR